jgi:hypothetical protein
VILQFHFFAIEILQSEAWGRELLIDLNDSKVIPEMAFRICSVQ